MGFYRQTLGITFSNSSHNQQQQKSESCSNDGFKHISKCSKPKNVCVFFSKKKKRDKQILILVSLRTNIVCISFVGLKILSRKSV